MSQCIVERLITFLIDYYFFLKKKGKTKEANALDHEGMSWQDEYSGD